MDDPLPNTDQTMPKTDRIAEILRAHEDTQLVQFAGEERPWLLGRRAFRLAKAADVDVDALLAELSGMGDAPTLAGTVETMARLLWVGFLPFDDSLELDDVADLIAVSDIERLSEVVAGGVNAALGGVEEPAKDPKAPARKAKTTRPKG